MQVQLPLRYLYLFVMFTFASGLIWLSAPTASQAQSNICQAVTQISAVECEALVTLYDSTHSTGWTQRASWLLTETPCEWHGVTCRDGHVVMLALSNNNLSGTLPSALGDLTHLEVLDLAENQLSGKLPPELGSLRQLKWLYLNDNAFSGPLPTSLMNLDNLEKLWFYHTNLCEAANAPLTTWLGSLADVQHNGVICVNVTTASVNLTSDTAITTTTPITMPDLDSTPVMTEVVGSMGKMTDTMKMDASAIMTEVMKSMAKMTSTENIDPATVAAEVMKSMAKMTSTTNMDSDAIAAEVMSALNKMTATMNMAAVATQTMTSTATMTSAADMNTSAVATKTITTTATMTSTTATDTITSTTQMTTTVATTTTANELTIANSKPLTAAATIPQSGGVLTSTNGAGLVLAAVAMLGLLMGGMVINRKFYSE